MTADTQPQPFCFNFSALALCLSGSMVSTTAYPRQAHFVFDLIIL
jgi:hypothetical protein